MKPTGRRAAKSKNRAKRPETPGNRAILAELDALGHGNRARARRETAFCAAKSRRQRADSAPRSSILEQLAGFEAGPRPPARHQPGFFRPFLWFLPKNAKKPQKPVTESGANFQQKIANWRISASFAQIFLGSRAGSRPLPNEIRRRNRRAGHRGPETGGRDPRAGHRGPGSGIRGPTAPDRTPGAPPDRVIYRARWLAIAAPRADARAAARRLLGPCFSQTIW